MLDQKRVLFLCVHNSSRSQMAEALVNHRLGDGYLVFSAGSEPTSLDPRAVTVMAEIGIDISRNRPKSVEELRGEDFDLVITLCAEEVCPAWMESGEKIHLPFPEPKGFTGTEDEILEQYRTLREDIWAKMRDLLTVKALGRER